MDSFGIKRNNCIFFFHENLGQICVKQDTLKIFSDVNFSKIHIVQFWFEENSKKSSYEYPFISIAQNMILMVGFGVLKPRGKTPRNRDMTKTKLGF